MGSSLPTNQLVTILPYKRLFHMLQCLKYNHKHLMCHPQHWVCRIEYNNYVYEHCIMQILNRGLSLVLFRFCNSFYTVRTVQKVHEISLFAYMCVHPQAIKKPNEARMTNQTSPSWFQSPYFYHLLAIN